MKGWFLVNSRERGDTQSAPPSARSKWVSVLLKHCVHWLFYSVVIALAFLWVAGGITIWTGSDVFWTRFADGSLLVFSLVRASTALAVHYEQICRTYGPTSPVPLGVKIFGDLICGLSLLTYILTLLVGGPVSINGSLFAIWSAAVATLYGLTCSLLDMRWLPLGRSATQ